LVNTDAPTADGQLPNASIQFSKSALFNRSFDRKGKTVPTSPRKHESEPKPGQLYRVLFANARDLILCRQLRISPKSRFPVEWLANSDFKPEWVEGSNSFAHPTFHQTLLLQTKGFEVDAKMDENRTGENGGAT
jgi:hypothetical protein